MMVFAYKDIMEVVRVLSDDRNMVVCVKENGKGALVTGGMAGLGGLLLGPIGLALGGAVGGVMAAVWARGKTRPLHKVITEEMSQHQRDTLVECLSNVLTNLEVTDALALVAAVRGDQELKDRLITEMLTFLSQTCKIYVNPEDEEEIEGANANANANEFPAPTEEARARIMQIHARKMNVCPDVNYEELAR